MIPLELHHIGYLHFVCVCVWVGVGGDANPSQIPDAEPADLAGRVDQSLGQRLLQLNNAWALHCTLGTLKLS